METQFKVGDQIRIKTNFNDKTDANRFKGKICFVIQISYSAIRVSVPWDVWSKGSIWVDIKKIELYKEKQIMEKQTILTLLNAKSMYTSGIESLKQLALNNFSKEELEATELPKTWKDLKKVEGYYVSNQGIICRYPRTETNYPFNANTFPTEELAKASLALSQLLQLRNVWWRDWLPYYGKTTLDNKFGIFFDHDKKELHAASCYKANKIFVFKSKDLAEEFLKTFKDLLWEARELI